MRYSDCLGKKSSKILLGTAYFGDGISKEDSYSIMDRFRELGGTHIDTARLYSGGMAEKIVGDWIKDRNATEMFVSTKGGYYEADAGEAPRLDECDIRSDLEKSLKALDVETIEFYWIHKDDETKTVEEIITLLNHFKTEGKIKKFGVSNWCSKRIKEANKFAKDNSLEGITASQIRFNPAFCLGERGGLVGMDNQEFQFYKGENMPVVAYSSQAKGFFSKLEQFGEAGLSEKAKKRYYCEENIRRFEVLKSISQKHECSIAATISAAFSSFVSPEVFSVIGPSNLVQLEDTMGGQDITLDKNELRDIFKFDI